MKKLAILFAGTLLLLSVHAQAQDYYVYVTAESEDEVSLIKFDGTKTEIIEHKAVGIWPAEIEGPHGITVDPSGKYWYLSLAHGNPYGTLYKYTTGENQLVGKVELGLFPASMQISKATGLLYCVNFNLHGDMVPSTVSVVDPEEMIELERITTGVMPHGSRISPDGMKQYSVGMMSGELFEIDALGMKVSRKLMLDEKSDNSMKSSMDHSKMDHSDMNHSKMDHSMPDHSKIDHAKMNHSKTKPTWVMPHPDGKRAYVAGNGSNEILEIDLKKWKVTDRWTTDKGPYNIDVSPDGKRLVVSYKTAGKTGIWDLNSNKELAVIQNSNKVTHGVAISSDSRYAFVSVEGIGGDPGAMDVIDLETNQLVTTALLGKQAGGIAFWKVD
ncbi:MAG: YncE family protein [Cyclobacteriaceae bacterium]